MSQPQIGDREDRRQAKEMLAKAQSPDDIARAYLSLGCISEHERDWEAAIANYTRALEARPEESSVQYFSNNNLGYSLIQLGRYDEAEAFCDAAIALDAYRHNAHKNLGLVYQGQGRWMDAAYSLLNAAWLTPEDPRAFKHLEQLLNTYPHLLSQSADLKLGVERHRLLLATDGAATVH